MPSVSPEQQRFLYWKKGPDWVKRHHFDVISANSGGKEKNTPVKHHKHKKGHK